MKPPTMFEKKPLFYAGLWGALIAVIAAAWLSGSITHPAGNTAFADSSRTPNAHDEALSAGPDTGEHAAVDRMVAIGDLHGDLVAAREALKLAGAIDDADNWVGGNLVVVQTGDFLDRGDDDLAVLDLLARLETEASKQGGAVYVLNGNHEAMNVAGDFRYVSPNAFAPFDRLIESSGNHALAKDIAARFPAVAHGRAAAFLPGGPIARALAKRPVVLKVGDTVFAHGGVLQRHIAYGIRRLNREVSKWFVGHAPPPEAILDSDAPIWTRRYGVYNVPRETCDELNQVLEEMGAKRLVVGHTIQKTITSACNEKVWRIDVGMSSHYGGDEYAVLEIDGDQVEILHTSAARN